MPAGKDMGMMLCDGEVDALISPQPRTSMLARPDRYRRLFPDVHAEEVRYFKKYGFFPIMHVVVLKRELADKFPELPREIAANIRSRRRSWHSPFTKTSNYSLNGLRAHALRAAAEGLQRTPLA